MKLLNLTSRYLLIVVLVILGFWSVIFHFSIQKVVYYELDEHLSSRTKELIAFIDSNPSLINKQDKAHKTDFVISKIDSLYFRNFSKKYPEGRLVDTVRFVEAENEEEPFRILETAFKNKGNFYKISLEVSVVDAKEMLNVILLNILGLSLVLALFILIFNHQLLQTLWKPFYNTLNKVKKYQLESHQEFNLEPSKIIEFQVLNSTFQDLIERNRAVYLQQKQFIENASHEIQTPLAIVMAKLELFSQSENLTDSQADLIRSVRENLSRLSRLNRSLLLLSKIENRQFENTEPIDITLKIKRIVDEYEEMTEFKKIQFAINVNANPVIQMNKELAYILFSNLIRNAIFHNYAGGFIEIEIKNNQISFTNSSKDQIIEPDKMFERFRKGTQSSFSQGLGLAIVASICEMYKLQIDYKVQSEIHIFSIKF